MPGALSGKRKILLLCPYPVGVAPGQRLKYEQYLEYLGSQGFEVEVSPFLDQKAWDVLYRPNHFAHKILGVCKGYARRLRDLWRASAYDGLYIFLHATPLGGSLLERLFRFRAKRIVYDIDDLVFLGRSSAANSYLSLFKRPEKYEYLMKSADHVVTCTPYLDAYARKFNAQTTDISSTIRTDVYLPVNAYSNDRSLTLGWSGSHSTVPYLALLQNVFQRLAERHRFTLRVIGTSKFSMPGVQTEAIHWTEASEVRDLQGIDIGVYPLPDEEWVLGKSGLKALQYMALGIPTVASALGTNFRVIESGVSGFLAKNEDEWVDYLERLILDPGLRKRLGQEARTRVEKLFSVQANQGTYLRIFQQVYK